VGYLKTAESRGFSLTDPTVIALLLLCGSTLLDLLLAITRKDHHWQRAFLTQWKGVASFGAMAAMTAISYLYSPAPTYGWDKLTRFLVISGVLFFSPLVLIRKTDDLRHFTLAMLICALLLSIKLLYGINDASLFDPTGHPLTSESREVTQIGAGQAVGFGLALLVGIGPSVMCRADCFRGTRSNTFLRGGACSFLVFARCKGRGDCD